MKIKPIPFNADMTKAIREGRKSVTRRPVKFTVQDVYGAACFRGLRYETYNPACPPELLKEWYVEEVCRPKYQPGEIVYVPEAWRLLEMWEATTLRRTAARVQFRDGDVVRLFFYDRERAEKWRKYLEKDKWQSPYFMPREAARLFLRVTSVRAERLQDIDGPAAEAEGALVVYNPVIRYDKAIYDKFGKKEFAPIWDSTVKPKDRDLYGWAANPWVWVIKFKRISKEEAMKA